jgi:hypothetical protein
MQLSHARRTISVRFDNPNFVSYAGLTAVLTLGRYGLGHADRYGQLATAAQAGEGGECKRAGPPTPDLLDLRRRRDGIPAPW